MDKNHDMALAYAQVAFKFYLEKLGDRKQTEKTLSDDLNQFKGLYEYALKYYSNFDDLTKG